MSSLATNPNMTPSEILSLNLNDSALDLLNAAIASHHQVKPDNEQQQQQPQPQHKNSVDSNTTEDEASSTSPVTTHGKEINSYPSYHSPTHPLFFFFFSYS